MGKIRSILDIVDLRYFQDMQVEMASRHWRKEEIWVGDIHLVQHLNNK